MTEIRFTDIQPRPTGGNEAAEGRWAMLWDAALHAELVAYGDRLEVATLDTSDLVKLRESAIVVGKQGDNRKIGTSSCFRDRAGYAWRWFPRHYAPVRKGLMARIDRAIEEAAA